MVAPDDSDDPRPASPVGAPLSSAKSMVKGAAAPEGDPVPVAGQQDGAAERILRVLPEGIPGKVFDATFGVEGHPDAPNESHAWRHADHVDPLARISRSDLGDLVVLHDSLLHWVRDPESDSRLSFALDSLLRVGRELVSVAPRTVVSVFRDLESTIKNLGNFRLIQGFARLAIDATQSTLLVRDAHILELEAQAMTCGTAWVHQRTGRLEDAEAELRRALHLNQDARCRRGEAFTLKCWGRLHRIVSERSDLCPTPADREARRAQSTKALSEARAMFREIHAMTAQVGDCLSLQARTALVGGHLDVARRLANDAALRLVDPDSKPAQDLAILRFEIEHALTEDAEMRASATAGLERVIETGGPTGHEIGEIVARAHFTRARMARREGRPWEDDFAIARAKLVSLGLRHGVAELDWWNVIEGGAITTAERELLEMEAPAVRTAAWRRRPEMQPDMTGAMHRELQGSDLRMVWEPVLEAARHDLAVEEADVIA
ncbi:MAG TPA: hypothetical protein VFU19_07805 [Iamia sp.]|nr:hypothetical protein [Iamia sp.]